MIRSLNRLQPYALMLLRVALGVTMVYHSWGKVYSAQGFRTGHFLAAIQHFNETVVRLGMPAWLGYVSTMTEFFGGLFVTVGLLARFWGLMIAGNMLVAIWTVNRHHGYSGSEYSIALVTMALMLLTAGSGAWSLDRRMGIS
jgi:putative oxidoreductase